MTKPGLTTADVISKNRVEDSPSSHKATAQRVDEDALRANARRIINQGKLTGGSILPETDSDPDFVYLWASNSPYIAHNLGFYMDIGYTYAAPEDQPRIAQMLSAHTRRQHNQTSSNETENILSVTYKDETHYLLKLNKIAHRMYLDSFSQDSRENERAFVESTLNGDLPDGTTRNDPLLRKEKISFTSATPAGRLQVED